MASKLTNYQLNIVVDRIWEEINKEVQEKNKKIIKDFDINSNADAYDALELFKDYIEVSEQIKTLKVQEDHYLKKLNEIFGYYRYTYKNIRDLEEVKEIIKTFFTKDAIIFINRKDIELEVISNQNSDISELINNIIKKFKEKLTN